MDKKHAEKILFQLTKHYPDAKIILTYSNNFELLVSVMLSAQTTDTQVNKVTKNLFPKYRKPVAEFTLLYEKFSGIGIPNDQLTEIVNFANVPTLDLEKDIRSIGLYKNKAKNVKAAAQMILTDFRGRIPKTIGELVKIPGVGRKTANVVLGNAYGIVEGIAVDTHVARLSRTYGFTRQKDPVKIEKDLMNLFGKKNWFKLTYLLIEHGRSVRKLKKDFILEKN